MDRVWAESRTLGATQVRTTALGFGAAAIGNLYRTVDSAAARAAVVSAFDAGVRYFDTAPHYGFGLSESRLGSALAEIDPTHQSIISTKVGRTLHRVAGARLDSVRQGFISPEPFEPVFDYSYDAVMGSYEASRKRLGRDHIDILVAHDLGSVTHGADDHWQFNAFLDGGYRAMRELRDAGVVGAIGLGVNEWEICERALANADFDCFLLAGRYTLLEQTALDTFLPLCEKRKVSIIVGGPFNSGILVNGTRGSGSMYYNYEPAPEAIVNRVRQIEAICDEHRVPLAAAALQFPLAHSRVVSVIPGLADTREVAQAIEWLETPIPESLWSALRDADLLHALAPVPSSAALSPLILLHEDDNVLVCRTSIARGASLTIDGNKLSAATAIPVGHKVARRNLPTGARIFKYGAPIGSMKSAVTIGGHVHLHNMQSDYIASHTREGKTDGHLHT